MKTAELPIEEKIYQRAKRLTAIGRAMASVFGSNNKTGPRVKPMDLKKIIAQIKKVIHSVPGAYGVFIGGMAVQEHGFLRFTEDIDLVVDAASYRKVLAALRDSGFELRVEGYLLHTASQVKVDLLKEGAKLKDSKLPLPHPNTLGPNTGFANLHSLIILKLDAGRKIDEADITKLLIPRLKQAAEIQQKIPAVLRPKFQELLACARKEAK